MGHLCVPSVYFTPSLSRRLPLLFSSTAVSALFHPLFSHLSPFHSPPCSFSDTRKRARTPTTLPLCRAFDTTLDPTKLRRAKPRKSELSRVPRTRQFSFRHVFNLVIVFLMPSTTMRVCTSPSRTLNMLRVATSRENNSQRTTGQRRHRNHSKIEPRYFETIACRFSSLIRHVSAHSINLLRYLLNDTLLSRRAGKC